MSQAWRGRLGHARGAEQDGLWKTYRTRTSSRQITSASPMMRVSCVEKTWQRLRPGGAPAESDAEAMDAQATPCEDHRVATLLRAVLLTLALGAAPAAHAAWMVETSTSPVDGTTSLWTTIDATEPPQSPFGTDMPGRLLVGCARPAPPAAPPGRLGVRLTWRPGLAFGLDAVPVRYRIDDGPPAREAWVGSDAGDGVARDGEDHLDLVAALAAGRTLFIEVEAPTVGPLGWRVDLARPRPAIVQVLAYCAGVPPREDLPVEALVRQWRETERMAAEREARAREARLREVRDAQARIRDAAAAAERAAAAYVEHARRTIAGYWVVPESARGRPTAVRVALTVDRAGHVLDATVETVSDDAALDWSVVNAVDKAREAGLPPLPAEYERARLDLVVTLDPSGDAPGR